MNRATRPTTASRPPESRRLEQQVAFVKLELLVSPASPPRNRGDGDAWNRSGISHAGQKPPHAPRNRGDWNGRGNGGSRRAHCRLTPPGIAATATFCSWRSTAGMPTASPPPESRRRRLNVALDATAPPRSASPPPESRRRRRQGAGGGRGIDGRLTPPGIAATATTWGLDQVTKAIPPHPPRNRGDGDRPGL